MAFDFPTTPTVGQIYNNYTWDGEKWLLRSTPTNPKKNYILNGAMMVSQENGTTPVTATSLYIIDGWMLALSLSGGAVSVGQVAKRTPAGSNNRIRCTVTAPQATIGASYAFIQARLEGLRIADLMFGTASVRTVTLQFGVNAPAGTYTVSLGDPASATISYPTFTIAAGEAGTDVVKSITYSSGYTTGTFPTDNTLGMLIGFYVAVAANTGAFMATNGNIFELFDVSLTEGSVAPPFVVPDYASELQACKRYWFKTYHSTQSPGTSTLVGAHVFTGIATYGETGGFRFPVEMRAAPTVTLYAPDGTTGKVFVNPTAGNTTASAAAINDKGIGGWSVPFGNNTSCIVHIVGNARI